MLQARGGQEGPQQGVCVVDGAGGAVKRAERWERVEGRGARGDWAMAWPRGRERSRRRAAVSGFVAGAGMLGGRGLELRPFRLFR